MSAKPIRVLAAALATLALLMWTRMPLSGQSGARNNEWRYYGGDAGSTKYSPLDQINKDNVKDLRIAWRWKTENFGARPDMWWPLTAASCSCAAASACPGRTTCSCCGP